MIGPSGEMPRLGVLLAAFPGSNLYTKKVATILEMGYSAEMTYRRIWHREWPLNRAPRCLRRDWEAEKFDRFIIIIA